MPVITPTPVGTVGNTYVALRESIDTNLNLINDAVNLNTATKAPLASPALTGTPTVPTAAADTTTTQAASTAFVVGQASAIVPLMAGTSAVGTSKRYSREDHKHPIDTSRAPLASPTLTGTPAAPTATADTTTTQLATTAFVVNQGSNANPLVNGTVGQGTSKRYSRQDHIHPIDTTRAPLASPTFTGTVAGITKAMVGLDSVDNTTDVAKPVSTAQQTALNLKANLASPTFTGTVAGISKSMVGLGSVDNTADTAKPVSTAQQTALNLKANLASPALSDTPTAPTAAVDTTTTQLATTAFVVNQGSSANPLVNGTVAQGTSKQYSRQDHIHPIDTSRAPLASPTFTGTVGGITKAMVGLANADNTSDAAKPISTAAQTALNLKAPLAGPTFTGTVSGVTKAMVGLGNVDNTSDANKPISSATQTALNTKVAKTSDTGALIVPAGTTAQRPVPGELKQIRFNSDLNGYEGFNGTDWGSLGGGATGGGSDKVFIENDMVVAANYTITPGKSAMSTGPITINNGVTVTVPDGSRWVIL